jgi:hypothetical protein
MTTEKEKDLQFYKKEKVEELLEEDELSAEEAAFMKGYLESEEEE